MQFYILWEYINFIITSNWNFIIKNNQLLSGLQIALKFITFIEKDYI